MTDEELDRAIDVIAADMQRPFNGVSGNLPKWFPPILSDLFLSARDALLRRYTEAELLVFLAAQAANARTLAQALKKPRWPRPRVRIHYHVIPADIRPLVMVLRVAQEIARMDEDRGLHAWGYRKIEDGPQDTRQSDREEKEEKKKGIRFKDDMARLIYATVKGMQERGQKPHYMDVIYNLPLFDAHEILRRSTQSGTHLDQGRSRVLWRSCQTRQEFELPVLKFCDRITTAKKQIKRST